MKRHATLVEDAKRFREEREGQLIRILTNFLSIQCVTRIPAVDDHYRESFYPFLRPAGTKRLQRLLGHPQKPVDSHNPAEPQACNTVLRAIVRSGYPLHSLELGGCCLVGGGDLGATISLSNVCIADRTFRPEFLRRLALTIDVGQYGFIADVEDLTAAWTRYIDRRARLADILARAPDLRELALEALRTRSASCEACDDPVVRVEFQTRGSQAKPDEPRMPQTEASSAR